MSALSEAFNTADAHRNELPSTYIVQDRQNQEEIIRLAIQDQMFTAMMGGALVEQGKSAAFRDVLDIGCGTGGWLIETARKYPELTLTGVDISKTMIDYASEQARGVSGHIKFQVMDALTLPGIANASFDLVNLRFGASYLRTWDWPRILREMVRVTRPGGTIQLTDSGIMHPSNSAALKQLCAIFLCALYRSNHLFNEDGAGIIPHLQTFLTQQRCHNIKVEEHTIEYQAGTPTSKAFYEDAVRIFRTARPFLQKWGCIPKDYDALYQQLLSDMQQPDFQASLDFSIVWGQTPG